jgi:D-glycero-D-manno-heptose 1,7-bisphosphate phosphatase
MERGLLLDRDGVINVDYDYVHTIDKFDFMPHLFPALRRAQDLGYRLAIVTNQAGIARGYYTEDQFWHLTRWMLGRLAAEGVQIGAVLCCPHHAEKSIHPRYGHDSFWRKPNPGMMLEAAARLQLDLPRSLLVGDRVTDLQAARAAGIGTTVFLNETAPKPAVADYQVTGWDQIIKLLG